MEQDDLRNVCDSSLASLKKKIKGYRVTERKTVYTTDAEGKKRVKEECVTTKYYPPDLSAIIFVLTNRAPAFWKQKQVDTEVAETISAGEKADLSSLSENTLRELSGLME